MLDVDVNSPELMILDNYLENTDDLSTQPQRQAFRFDASGQMLNKGVCFSPLIMVGLRLGGGHNRQLQVIVGGIVSLMFILIILIMLKFRNGTTIHKFY